MQDFEGQALSEYLYQVIIGAFTAIGFIWGWWCQDFAQTTYVTAAGVVLACILCLPAWPFYQRNPVQWLRKEE
ncbi:uncharacterized protein MONBRDRAFT_13509 [Monosiga brevicollis MX1]|uniref:Signal peptidase complex subunit 1 n=1 Tax=Monosiga brevicollis TaxID=81824 RepID=A9UPP6_MONBE|nr:uncharacterized protein MONBRDRAFT_13509 [Monosiga brevicollis MX1]EDQ92460.1 predicted protein [Monosiga brevicollis MX1]|eukprot:XP_001742222.1 hypothetical protein [Monosiga brevicollis MX1]